MKTIIARQVRPAALAALVLFAPAAGMAAATIGSWQDNDGDGWIDWGNWLSITDPANSAVYSFVSGAVSGYPRSLQINETGWNQNLAIRLQDHGFADDFMNNHLLSFTFSVPAHTAGGFSQLVEFAINATGLGWHPVPFDSRWTATGATADNIGTQPNFWFWDGSPARSQRVTLDYSSLLGAITPNPGQVELVFAFNNGDGAPANFFINDVTLIPEPTSFALAVLGGAGLLVARRRRNR